MEDVLDFPDEVIINEEQEEEERIRQQKYLNRFWSRPMVKGTKYGPGGSRYEVPGKWIAFEDDRPPVYVKDETHIRRLINEQGGHVIQDPRPGIRNDDISAVPGIVGPAGRPPEPPESVKKINALEKEIGTLKEGMSQIIALLQAKNETPEHTEEQSQAKAKK